MLVMLNVREVLAVRYGPADLRSSIHTFLPSLPSVTLNDNRVTASRCDASDDVTSKNSRCHLKTVALVVNPPEGKVGAASTVTVP